MPKSHYFHCDHFILNLVIEQGKLPIYSLNYFGSFGHFIIPYKFLFQFIKFQDLLLIYRDSNQDGGIGREIDTYVSRTENPEIDSYKYSWLIL